MGLGKFYSYSAFKNYLTLPKLIKEPINGVKKNKFLQNIFQNQKIGFLKYIETMGLNKERGDGVNLYFDKKNEKNYDIIKKCSLLYKGSGKFNDREKYEMQNESSVEENKAKFCPPFILRNNILMAIYAAYTRSKPSLKIKRSTIVIPNCGATVSLDYYDSGDEYRPDTPTIVVVPYLSGSSYTIFMQYFGQCAMKSGYRVVVFNPRGLGGNKITHNTPQNTYTISDYQYVFENVLPRECPGAPLFAVGFCQGAILLLNYIAHSGDKNPFMAHVSLSNCFDGIEMFKLIKKSIVNRFFYYRTLTNTLNRYYMKFEDKFENYFHNDEPKKLKYYELESLILGFNSIEKYSKHSSSIKFLERINKPLLMINALNDPFSPVHTLPYEQVKKNPNTILATTQTGGHLCFLTKDWDSWSDKVVLQYFNCFLENTDKKISLKEKNV